MAATVVSQSLAVSALPTGLRSAAASSSRANGLAVNRRILGGVSLRRTIAHRVAQPELARRLVVRSATESETPDVQKVLKETVDKVADAWDKTDDKLAIGGLGVAAIVALWAAAGLIGAIDKLPLIPGLFELVGIVFTGWFVYRYLLFKPDREELLKLIEENKAKITGK